jgi:hypothetical protein
MAIFVKALRALASHAALAGGAGEPAVLERLPLGYAAKLRSEENPAARRGLALALVELPLNGGQLRFELGGALGQLLVALGQCGRVGGTGTGTCTGIEAKTGTGTGTGTGTSTGAIV